VSAHAKAAKRVLADAADARHFVDLPGMMCPSSPFCATGLYGRKPSMRTSTTHPTASVVIAAAILLLITSAALADPAIAASALAHRLLGQRATEIQFMVIPPDKSLDVFEIEAAHGKAVIRGNNGVAMASGLNWYLKHVCRAQVSWCGDQLNLPRPLPSAEKTRIVSPYRCRYFFNYCSFSYTMAFWDWDRWQREIDWMALNGINMPLAVVGQEAVWQNLYRKMGLSDKEIQQFFVGPAYLPFGWMGCIDGWAGPLSQAWIDEHAELGRRILARQRELGMTPVLQGFTGHVSSAIQAHMPDLKLQRLPSWCGFPGTYFVDPATPTFQEIGKAFLEEQNRLFGTDHLYASDTFIEMSPPSSEPAFLARMGKSVYEGMAAADPQAVWVMQGWIFVNNPDFWKPPQSKALLSAVPDDRMILLDLFCDSNPSWKLTESFYGKPWIWCVLHNFGGVTGLYGNLATLAHDPPALLAEPKRGRLCGLGMMMEAFGHNPIYYELMSEMTWRTRPPDLGQWVSDYATRRYGQARPKAMEAWSVLRSTAYSSGLVDSILCARPRLNNSPASPAYDPQELLKAWQLLLECADELAEVDPYRYDLVDVARQVLANLAAPFYADMMAAFQQKDPARLKAAGDRYLHLIRDLDALLGTRREFLLGQWIADAKRWARNDQERALYEWNARNQITLWGPRHSALHDYARKQWSGLLSGFYHRRWELFLQRLHESLSTGQAFDADRFEKDIRAWEDAWTHQSEPYASAPLGDSITTAADLLKKYQPLIQDAYRPEAPSLTTGKPVTCSHFLPPYAPQLANDGRIRDTNRFWATDITAGHGAWWQVDLEKPATVGRVVIVGYYGDPRHYGFTIEASNDGKSWDTLADRRDNTELSTANGYSCAFAPRMLRYIRVTLTHNSANTGRHLVEVQAFER